MPQWDLIDNYKLVRPSHKVGWVEMQKRPGDGLRHAWVNRKPPGSAPVEWRVSVNWNNVGGPVIANHAHPTTEKNMPLRLGVTNRPNHEAVIFVEQYSNLARAFRSGFSKDVNPNNPS